MKEKSAREHDANKALIYNVLDEMKIYEKRASCFGDQELRKRNYCFSKSQLF
jgi:hypothetical protein